EWICDNVPDCLTGEDEANCHYLHNCPKDLFMCRTGECLSTEVKCDGHFNCSDGSDEHGCEQIASVLLPSTSPAPPSSQIAYVLLPSTSPASPSPSLCHPDNEFACNNGTCISAEWICDNVPDCLTGE
uniref:Very low density lipoprotein receptor n=1 Tax=Panagrolaimus sp. PS1159 TaxID=55785 RepID=A0AC35FDX0_9BILA